MAIEAIDATLKRIVYAKVNKFSDSGLTFVIAKAITSKGESVTIKGDMINPIPYESYRFYGESGVDEKYQNEACFKFKSFHVISPSSKKGAARYLSRYIPQIGSVTANVIVEYLGDNTIDRLVENPELVHWITEIKSHSREAVELHFKSSKVHHANAIAELTSLFDGYSIPQKVVESLVEQFGSSAIMMVEKNPYILINFPRMGWDKVDALARGRFNIPIKARIRIVAAIQEAMNRQSDSGHTYAGRSELESGLFALVGLRSEDTWFEWAILDDVLHCDLIKNNPIYQLLDHYRAEKSIARDIVRLSRDVNRINVDLEGEGLEDDQIEAFEMILNNGFSVLAGIPGSGKTYTVAKFSNELQDYLHDMIFTFGAPTGRAAKKLKELLDYHNPNNNFTCSTIHKILRWVFSEKEAGVSEKSAKSKRGRPRFDFSEDEDDGLPIGTYVLEESSMIDIFMEASVLNRIPSGSRVIMVGDPYQIQSIRAGAVIRDILAAKVPSVVLEKPRRNAGRIVRSCYEIKNGVTPRPSAKLDLPNGENWIHLGADSSEAIQKLIIGLHEKTKMDKFWDIQVISPQKDKEFIGCEDLNKVLSKLLNPKQSDVMGNERSGLPFTIGDKVIRTKNGTVNGFGDLDWKRRHKRDWTEEEWYVNVQDENQDAEKPNADVLEWNGAEYEVVPIHIVNGDLGIVLGSVSYDNRWHVVVEFKNPRRTCILPIADHKITLAYAITVHKCQGSSAKCIIAPLSNLFYSGLFTRELVYTTFSRAEDILITVGSMDALREAVKRKTIDQRRTRLKDFVVEEITK